VIDLMALLKKRLGASGSAPKRFRAKKAARKKKTRRQRAASRRA
jgi:hypothetical protein